jgi:alpha-L-fucosidase
VELPFNLSALILIVALVMTGCACTPCAGAEPPKESPKLREDRMQWWLDARFGMFIHWGTYALAARHEWVKNYERIPDEVYQKYFQHFGPDLYDPKAWARAARQAGMRYFVITTKHHEGFCLWDTQFTDYKATRTPCGKDLIKPMVEAFRAEGLRVGFYYSLLDWHHPDYPVDGCHPMRDNKEFREKAKGRDVRKYVDYMENQLRELLTGFGPIDCLFLDFSFPGPDGKGRKDWQSERLLRLIRELQPNCIINDRLDLLDRPDGWDFRTPEQFMPRSWVSMDGLRVPWETCQTFSGSWGYHRDEATWKSPEQLVVMLIETVSKGGNLLLNVGPTARGTFDGRALERLQAIGDWMRLHSRAIYGCTQAPDGFKKPDNCLLTYNPKTRRLYVHVLVWPMGKLPLDGFAGKVAYAQLLNDASEVKFSENKGAWMAEQQGAENGITLELPMLKPNVLVPVVELFLK